MSCLKVNVNFIFLAVRFKPFQKLPTLQCPQQVSKNQCQTSIECKSTQDCSKNGQICCGSECNRNVCVG